MKKSSFISIAEEKTQLSGQFLGERVFLKPHWAKDIFLFGDLGSGKTTFIRGFANAISKKIKIKSPTFTYLCEHDFQKNNDNWGLAHFDLYRLKDVKDDKVKILELLNEKLQNKKTINIIEWSENIPVFFALPKNRIEIHFEYINKNKRLINAKFYDCGVPNDLQIKKLLKEYATPKHVQNHQKKVAKVANFLAKNIYKNGYFVDTNLVNASALLHDLVRIVNFPNLDNRANFKEKITDKKITIWKNLMSKYAKFHHGDIAAKFLNKQGFCSCAEVIFQHKSKTIFTNQKMTLEEEIVYFADKKVLHDNIVTLHQRFEDGKIRHNVYSAEKQNDLENRVKKLGNKLFSYAELKDEKEFDKKLSICKV